MRKVLGSKCEASNLHPDSESFRHTRKERHMGPPGQAQRVRNDESPDASLHRHCSRRRLPFLSNLYVHRTPPSFLPMLEIGHCGLQSRGLICQMDPRFCTKFAHTGNYSVPWWIHSIVHNIRTLSDPMTPRGRRAPDNGPLQGKTKTLLGERAAGAP